MIVIGGKAYELVTDHKNGWNQEVFRERYSEVLDRYDYIVGDWGYNQLRLRGFFKDTNPKATKESTISSIQDYLNEYCNFGCAYFVVERVPGRNVSGDEEGYEASADQESAGTDDSAPADDDMSAYTHRGEALQQSGQPLRTHMRPQHRPRQTQAQTAQWNSQSSGGLTGGQQNPKAQQGAGYGQHQQGKQQGQPYKQQGGGAGQSAQAAQFGGKGPQGPSNQQRNKQHGGHSGQKPQQHKAQQANAKQAASSGQVPPNRNR